MGKKEKIESKIPAMKVSLARKAWLNIALFLLAVVVISFGVYLNTQPEWTKRTDIKLYNQGASAYTLPAELLPATDERPSEYPIVRAAAYFQQVTFQSTDDRLLTLALYNLGTLMGKDSLTVLSGSTPWFGLMEGISILEEAIRIDPDNENAKYNLELLEKLQEAVLEKPMPEQMPMAALVQKPGHSLGEDVDKGF